MLEGVRVVDFSTWVAGPGASAVMADWGADVIKIESRGGDATRAAGATESSTSPVFEMENRGKRGIVLDTGTEQGREALIRIAGGADILITNVRPRSLKRARLDYDSIKDELPHLVYCSVSGYGLEGDDVDVPAFDIAALWTRAGLASATIPEGVEPFTSRPAVGDAACALATAAAALAALHEKRTTGRGRLVETSLIRTGVFTLGWDMSIHLKTGTFRPTRGRRQPANPPANYYRTADDHWLLTLSRGKDDWEGILTAAGHAELIDDPRFATLELRAQNGAELTAILDAAFGALTLDEARRRLTEVDAMWAPLQSLAEVAADPQAIAAGCFVEVEDRNGERFLSPAAPARFHGAPDAAPKPAPGLGQHTREVLAEAGYSAEQIDELIASGAASVIEA